MPNPTRRTLIATAAAAALPLSATAAPRARLIDRRWTRFGTGAEPDHGAWDAILSRATRMGGDGVVRFDYAGTPKAQVAGYVDSLAGADPTAMPQAAAFAYWVNLYNALTVKVVQDHWPVASIREIGGGLFSGGPWRQTLVTVAGQPLSLDDIEHGILRPIWRDPRIHYAVNCASIGCPNIARRAYTAGRLGRMLGEGAAAYVNHPRGAARLQGGGLVVSSIYDWFREDFGGSEAGVLAHLAEHATPQTAQMIREGGDIRDHRYDWSINA